MATLPPKISYYAAAAAEELRLHRLQIEEMHAAAYNLTRRAAELETLLRACERLTECIQNVGEVIDYVSPDETVGEFPNERGLT
jgi:hypothetical protein